MGEIRPALTPEQWTAWADGAPQVRFDSGGTIQRATIEASRHMRHARAALYLHGQPFGFTQEIADEVLAAAHLHLDVAKWIAQGLLKAPDGAIEEHQRAADGLLEVYDRIAALLPPKDARG